MAGRGTNFGVAAPGLPDSAKARQAISQRMSFGVLPSWWATMAPGGRARLFCLFHHACLHGADGHVRLPGQQGSSHLQASAWTSYCLPESSTSFSSLLVCCLHDRSDQQNRKSLSVQPATEPIIRSNHRIRALPGVIRDPGHSCGATDPPCRYLAGSVARLTTSTTDFPEVTIRGGNLQRREKMRRIFTGFAVAAIIAVVPTLALAGNQ